MSKAGLIAAACLLAASTAFAADVYPVRPVRIIVPFAPGGATDIVARLVGQKLNEGWGQPVVVDNRAGAGGNIAAELAAAAPADGHTIYQFNIANAISPGLYKKLNYDPVKDFSAVTLLGSSPFILVVHPSVKATNLQEFIALTKSQPGKFSYASSGNGGPSHLATEMMKSMAGIPLTHVPYKGVATVINDLLSGQVQVTFTVPGSGLPHVKTGRLRGLAVTTAKRSAVVPDIPTIAESGVPGYDMSTWYAVTVPAGTPRPIISKLHTDMTQTLQLPDVRERLIGAGADLVGSTPEFLAGFIKTEIAKWTRVVKQADVRID